LLNPTGFTVRSGSAKDDQLRKFMEESEVDIMAFPEVNVCWHRVQSQHRLEERTLGWFETLHRSIAYNHKEHDARRQQYGGNVLLSINNAAHRVMEAGRDSSGLGRWTWTRYRGRNNITTRVICAYRPCFPTGSDKSFSVYTQHQRYFDERNDDICPREAFIRDLSGELDHWLLTGDQIIIALDANEDMRTGAVATAFRSRHLREVILDRHGNNAPPTTDNGSTVIDGIWATPIIQIECGGYLAGGGGSPTD
jgi:hypothetical protein